MAIDASQFIKLNVADTCSLWNILSSSLLYARAKDAGCQLCCTDYVRYECLLKPRRALPPHAVGLRETLASEIEAKRIPVYNVEVADLLDNDVFGLRARLGHGEISTLAFAKKTRQAMLTDDQRARKRIRTVLETHPVQTTSHLLSWLGYLGRVLPHEIGSVLRQHASNGGQIGIHLQNGFNIGVSARQKEDSDVESATAG